MTRPPTNQVLQRAPLLRDTPVAGLSPHSTKALASKALPSWGAFWFPKARDHPYRLQTLSHTSVIHHLSKDGQYMMHLILPPRQKTAAHSTAGPHATPPDWKLPEQSQLMPDPVKPLSSTFVCKTQAHAQAAASAAVSLVYSDPTTGHRGPPAVVPAG